MVVVGKSQKIRLIKDVESQWIDGHVHKAGLMGIVVESVGSDGWLVEIRVPDTTLEGDAWYECADLTEKYFEFMSEQEVEYRAALDAILKMTGVEPESVEYHTAPNYGDVVRQAVRDALVGRVAILERRLMLARKWIPAERLDEHNRADDALCAAGRWTGDVGTVPKYLTILRGVLAARTMGPISQETEAELAEVMDDVWRLLTEEEKAELDPELIEAVKHQWAPAQSVSGERGAEE